MLRIRIETKNEAFVDNLRSEVIRCLEDVISNLDNFIDDYGIFDINGNKVGSFKLTK